MPQPTTRLLILLALAVGVSVHAAPCRAQITSLADDIILISKGVQVQENQRTASQLGGAIGGSENSLGASPGSRQSRLQTGQTPGAGGGPSAYGMRNRDVLSAAASEGQTPAGQAPVRIVPPQQAPPIQAPLYGTLELPESDNEGPADGLTLETAIARLIQVNHELRSKYYEIPQARADVLTASLRANPLVFGSISAVPYGSFGPSRPGNTNYSATVIYPVDVSHKRLARTEVACQAARVIEAQYQDAVRAQVEILHAAYVDVLSARETYRYALASRDGLQKLVKLAETQLQGKAISRPDFDRIAIQADTAEIGVEQAEASLRSAKQTLGLELDYSREEADRMELRATLHDAAPPPPTIDELVSIAREHRPDLSSYRLGVQRARADVKLAEAEKVADVFLLYSPWELQDNRWAGAQNSTSWSVAAFGSVPLFNRNQGNIRRAQENVSQTRVELEAIEHHIRVEVDQALAEYQASLATVQRIESTILPRSRRIRDASLNLLRQGESSALDFLAAQRDYNDVVRQYRDALIRHRRAMLKLNTAVGLRILP